MIFYAYKKSLTFYILHFQQPFGHITTKWKDPYDFCMLIKQIVMIEFRIWDIKIWLLQIHAWINFNSSCSCHGFGVEDIPKNFNQINLHEDICKYIL